MKGNVLKTVVFAGGGTGGHLQPGLAVAAKLRERGMVQRIVFVGSKRGVEQRILAESGFEHLGLDVPALRDLVRRPWRGVPAYRKAKREAKELLREMRPAVVIGLGGMASVPLVTRANCVQAKVMLLEQNVVMGRANHWLRRFADLICVSFEETLEDVGAKYGDKVRVTGNPIRGSLVEAAAVPRERSGDKPFHLLVLGGSQGSREVNEMVMRGVKSKPESFRRMRITHQTGSLGCEAVREMYEACDVEGEVAAYYETMPELYRTADLVISRAGATSLAEYALFGLPAILIPYANSVRDHQRKNAEWFARRGAAQVFPHVNEPKEGAEWLLAMLGDLLKDRERFTRMGQAMNGAGRPAATELVVQEVARLWE